MFSIGTSEIIILLLIVVLLLGPKRLPEIAKTLGKLIGSAKRVGENFQEDIKREISKERKDGLIDSAPSDKISSEEEEDFYKKTYGDALKDKESSSKKE